MSATYEILKKYKGPTKGNIFWTLPPAEDLVTTLKVFGGNVNEMLNRLSGEEADQSQIMFLIEEELAKPHNDTHKRNWDRYQLMYYRSQIAIGTGKVLSDYAAGKTDKHQFVKDVGKQIMPGVFAPGIGVGAKDQIEQQVDRHMTKYGEQPEESNSSV